MARRALALSLCISVRTLDIFRSLTLCAIASALLFAGSRASAQTGCGTALDFGFNPSFQTFYSRAIVFADAFQRVGRFTFWDHGPRGDAPLIPVGSGRLGAGWPDPARLARGERFGAILFVKMERTIPPSD